MGSSLVNVISMLLGLGSALVVAVLNVQGNSSRFLSQSNLFSLVPRVVLAYLSGLAIYPGISIFLYGLFGRFPLGETAEDYQIYFSLLGIVLALMGVIAILLLVKGERREAKMPKKLKSRKAK